MVFPPFECCVGCFYMKVPVVARRFELLFTGSSLSLNFIRNATATRNRANGGLGALRTSPHRHLQLRLSDTIELASTAEMVINPTYLAQRTRSCMWDAFAKH